MPAHACEHSSSAHACQHPDSHARASTCVSTGIHARLTETRDCTQHGTCWLSRAPCQSRRLALVCQHLYISTQIRTCLSARMSACMARAG
eukprot:118913-Rhodomonas_salina.1